jgi:CRP/FNR family cyclic AMP-dependent transcriptional regulator
MKKEAFRQHQTIFKAGDQAGKVYLLARGSVGIFLPDNDSKEPNFLIPENEIFGDC